MYCIIVRGGVDDGNLRKKEDLRELRMIDSRSSQATRQHEYLMMQAAVL